MPLACHLRLYGLPTFLNAPPTTLALPSPAGDARRGSLSAWYGPDAACVVERGDGRLARDSGLVPNPDPKIHEPRYEDESRDSDGWRRPG